MTTPQALHHYLEASALAFADRGAYVGDPAFVNVPTRRLTVAAVRRRARLPRSTRQHALVEAAAGGLHTAPTRGRAPDGDQPVGHREGLSTTHLVAVGPLGQRRSPTR